MWNSGRGSRLVCCHISISLIKAGTASSGDPAASFAPTLVPQRGYHALTVGCRNRNDGPALDTSYDGLSHDQFPCQLKVHVFTHGLSQYLYCAQLKHPVC